MIKFENVSFGFPQKDLYNDISFEISDGDHIALVGMNGVGKSSLINLLMEPEKFTYEGTIEKDTVRIGHTSQFVRHESDDLTSFDFLARPFVELLAKSDELCAEMGTAENLDEVFENYQNCQSEIDALDAYNYATNIKKMLALAGLVDVQDVPVNSISGGEYKLLFIVQNMLLRPDLLIMDEPDVFLDFDNIVGLSKLINNYHGSVLTITHSRLLLSQCFDKIFHIEGESLEVFPGTFAEYNKALLETKIEMAASAHAFDEFIEIQESLIERLRHSAEITADPKKGNQLRARVTYLEKLRVMRGDDPVIHDASYDFFFPKVEVPEGDPGLVLSVKDYSLSYDRPILSDVNFDVYEGQKIAIVGANGTGKSSLLLDIYKMLEASLEPGDVYYFKQIINPDEKLKLSGGELNVKALTEMCQGSAKVLLLDEPTSHLDTYAQVALEQAIQNYKGTVLMVSHDFFTIASCADRIFLLEDGTLKEVSPRNYRKSIYKNYFDSDIFENEKKRIDTEVRINSLIRAGKFKEAKELLNA